MTIEAVESGVRAPEVVLTTAVCNAADRLGLKQSELSRVLHISTASVSRLRHDQRSLQPSKAEHELGLLLIRLFRGLDALVGGDEGSARRWLRAHNRHLGGVPLDLIQTLQGLTRVVGYLDAMRGTL